jgi:hypothetical protein
VSPVDVYTRTSRHTHKYASCVQPSYQPSTTSYLSKSCRPGKLVKSFAVSCSPSIYLTLQHVFKPYCLRNVLQRLKQTFKYAVICVYVYCMLVRGTSAQLASYFVCKGKNPFYPRNCKRMGCYRALFTSKKSQHGLSTEGTHQYCAVALAIWKASYKATLQTSHLHFVWWLTILESTANDPATVFIRGQALHTVSKVWNARTLCCNVKALKAQLPKAVLLGCSQAICKWNTLL